MRDEDKFYMLNALWFKPDGGRETYQRYMRAAGPIVARFGGRPLPAFKPFKAVIGNFDADLVFFVEWPSWTVFKQFTNDPEYKEVMRLREEAINDSLLIRCQRLD